MSHPHAIRKTTLAAVAVLLTACGGAEGPATEQTPSREETVPERAASPPPADATDTAEERRSSRRPRVVFLGDSLTAGYGLDEKQAFPAIVGRRLDKRGPGVTIVNAGVSGDTTAGGLSRAAWVLRQQPDVLVVGLGGNDGLRGLSPEMTEANLREILVQARSAGAVPILLGMRLPPNLGRDYVGAFESVYPRLAAELDLALVPFLLEGVAGDPALNLPDGIHPTAEGHRILADTVMPWIEQALGSLANDSAQERTENGATQN